MGYWLVKGSTGDITDLDTYGAYTIKMSGFGMPPLQWNAQERALIPGATVQNVKVKPRALLVTFDVEGNSLANYHYKRKQLIDAFKPDRTAYVNGKPVPIILQYIGAGSTIEIEANYAGGLEGELEEGFGEKIPVLFIAHDPYFYSPTDGSTTLTYTQTSTGANSILKRTDGAWSDMGNGANGPVYAVAIGSDRTFYAGGGFSAMDGVANTGCIARWNFDSSAWSAMSTGADSDVFALLPDPAGNLYVGGAFTQIGASTGGFLAKWNGSTFATVSTGVTDDVQALCLARDGTLYVGGVFRSAGGSTIADYVAKWNGSTWAPLSTTPLAGGVGVTVVYAIAEAANGDIYVGGIFSSSTGPEIPSYLAKYTPGTLGFTALTTTPLNEQVQAIVAAPDGSIYIGGLFTNAGGTTGASYIARYNGSRFEPLGSGLNGGVYSLAIDDHGLLYVGGIFTEAGGLSIADRLAVWNGYTWAHVPIDLPGTPYVYGIAVRDDDLLVCHDTGGSTATSAYLNTVSNDGSAETRPVLAFTCNTTGATLPTVEWVKNESNSKTLYLNYTLQKGETLTVDTDAHTIQSDYFGNVPRAVLPNSDMGSFSLLPGSNNLSVFVTGSSTQCTVNATWQERYWSVDGVSTST